MMLSKKNAVLWIVGALILSLSTGCSRGDLMVDPNEVDNGTQQTDTNVINNNNSTGTGNGIYNPGGSTGQYQAPVQITATVDKKMSGVWIFKKIKAATVTLQNPSNQNVTGKVIITFSKKGAQTETVEKTFSIGPAGSTTVDVQPTKSADEAVANATTDAATGNTGTTGGFPASGGTGTGSGTYPW